MAKVDQDAARRAVSAWIDAHPDGTLTEMADELKKAYPEDQQKDMTIVLRGMGVAEIRRHPYLPPGVPPDPPEDSPAAGEQR
ncbi:MAG: hypothetical protein ABSA53_21635 [Streptosporangiaceae bacterium]|jgi:hypothetical protein